jgi:hypothetical protein
MNLQGLQKNLGQTLRLRPLPIRLDANGIDIGRSDDPWRLDAILKDPNRIRLSNLPTGHFVELQSDNVKQFQSPDFLILRCQLTIVGRTITLEPIFQFDERFERLEQLMPALLDEMRKDMSDTPLRREIVLLEKTWIYNGKGNELVYYFDEHPDLLAKMQVLANLGCVTEITYNNVSRFMMSEELAQYLGA